MKPKEIKTIMSKYGEYTFIRKKYGRFKADKDSDNRNYKAKYVYEYVHILKRN